MNEVIKLAVQELLSAFLAGLHNPSTMDELKEFGTDFVHKIQNIIGTSPVETPPVVEPATAIITESRPVD